MAGRLEKNGEEIQSQYQTGVRSSAGLPVARFFEKGF